MSPTSHGTPCRVLTGVACAPGRAAGRTWCWPRPGLLGGGPQERSDLGPRPPALELEAAISAVRDELDARQLRLAAHVQSELGLLEVQRALLQDPAFAGQARSLAARGAPAQVAIEAAVDHAVATLLGPGDPLLAARCPDVRQLGERLQRALAGASLSTPLPDHPVVLVARDLPPDILLELLGPARAPHHRIRALLLERGGPLTHLCLLARNRGIPVVGGLAGLCELLAEGRGVLVDGDRGEVVLDPDPPGMRRFLDRPRSPAPAAVSGLSLWAALDLPEEAALARERGARGVGLLRTDRMLVEGRAPEVEEQARRYALALRAFPGTTVVVRTFDAPVPGPDPSLGPRGARWFDLSPGRSSAQIRALCLAAAAVPEARLCVLLPMVSRVEEVARVRRDVAAAWTHSGPPPMVGAMVETPAAALEVERLLDVAELLVIGSNDLLQLTVGASREDPRVAPLLDPDHPALWRLLRQVAAAGRARGRPVLLCGALGADRSRLARVAALGVEGVGVGLADLRRVSRFLSPRGVDTTQRGS